MKTQHTPTPWRQSGTYIESDTLKLIARAIPLKGRSIQEDEEKEKIALLNAEFIVRAVNSHKTILDALDLAYGLLTEFSGLASWQDKDDDVMEIIEKAIARAEVK